MKNIHILPTENSSRLSYNKDGVLELHRLQWRKNTQNIHITSAEDIKAEDWCLLDNNVGISEGYKVLKCDEADTENGWYSFGDMKTGRCIKIILTTDPQLIADGVQVINDDFLEWFVKNPSFEEINAYWYEGIEVGHFYKIDIPKEEPKQETPEEVAERLYPVFNRSTAFGSKYPWTPQKEREAFVRGVKWHSEKSYSEEEVFDLLLDFANEECGKISSLREWFEQFKKK